MSETTLKCENNKAIFKQNYTLKLFIALKMAYSCFFGLNGNLDFRNFLHKCFITLNPGWIKLWKRERGGIDSKLRFIFVTSIQSTDAEIKTSATIYMISFRVLSCLKKLYVYLNECMYLLLWRLFKQPNS